MTIVPDARKGVPKMLLRLIGLLGLLSLPLALFVLAGCGGSSLNDVTSTIGGVSEPPIHVVFTRGAVAYTPAQIRHAYGIDKITGTGSGQTIAIVDAYGSPTIQNDLNVFCQKYGLPTTTITLAYPTGKPAANDSGWALETALDVEWAHAIAPGATILLVVAKSNSNVDLLAAVDYAAIYAAQVSMSWGGNEFSGESAQDIHFNKTGVTFLAASGDSGAGVEWPAVSPYVVGVGGTTLYLDSAGNRTSAEVAWSGSGGGQSSYVSRPAFQSAWLTSSRRQVPDVSFNGNPGTGYMVYDSTPYQRYTGWFVVGGTSAGAPQWAAVIALANASRTAKLTWANNALYTLGSPGTLTTNYVDILSGSNGKYKAGTGYDMVTGLGTPQSAALIPKLITSP